MLIFVNVAGKKITLDMNGHERCPVLANELLHDVFSNLVSNAIKHTGNCADIIVNLETGEDEGRPVCRVTVEPVMDISPYYYVNDENDMITNVHVYW